MGFSKVNFLGAKMGFIALILGFLCGFSSFVYASDLAEIGRKCRNNGGQSCIEAFDLYKKACDSGDNNACGNVGQYLLNGTGIEANTQEAIAHLSRACDNGLAQYCFALGTNYANGTNNVQQDKEVAAELFKKACSFGFVAACKK